MGGSLITEAAKLNGARIIPADSEHNAIHQCLSGKKQDLDSIVLTASKVVLFGISHWKIYQSYP